MSFKTKVLESPLFCSSFMDVGRCKNRENDVDTSIFYLTIRNRFVEYI